jgi:hypothetical protein
MTTVRNYRDCTRWTKRLETKWNGTPNAYTKGAVAAVACGTPDTIRPTPGVRQLALFRFRDVESLRGYWSFKLAKIGKPLRQTSDACTGGKQGLRSWRGAAGSGTIACYLDAGRAKLRWTNEHNNTYGVVDATHKNIRRLADWWRSADI